MTPSASSGVANALLSPPPVGTASETALAVFDDPHGLRRVVAVTVGALVCLGCLAVLALAGGILYADPHAPAARPPVAGRTSTLR
ncbi:hypothetical protein [Kitasatospora viridis]|uniref:Uncharacterized protein n=1 Tax=Kitasatospora viridis TaxID=281105 RepID=A0A561TS97_9ACTN|nr:hypothetical protein [Kitasatospora viridis]TWF89986.1 hypothetical protein FHX73_1330 [Kitasatospora viridis]